MTNTAANEFLEGKILLIDKPLNWTSFDVVNKIRYSLKKNLGIKKVKVGHAGTLDPLASGLLILCTGKKTKSIDEIQKLTKTYSGIFTIGATTASFDLESEVVDKKPISHVDDSMIKELERKYKGEIDQVPPVFSAVKHKGKRAYELAREGQELKLESRKVIIYSMELERTSDTELTFNIVCGKGTYIRSIARDIGKDLGCGAYLSLLRRERIGEYSVEDAHSIDEMIEHIEKSASSNQENLQK